jgi:hypothetical protein
MTHAPVPDPTAAPVQPDVDVAVEQLHASTVARDGIEHTHDLACRTWRGQNWAGACDCTLPARRPVAPA